MLLALPCWLASIISGLNSKILAITAGMYNFILNVIVHHKMHHIFHIFDGEEWVLAGCQPEVPIFGISPFQRCNIVR